MSSKTKHLGLELTGNTSADNKTLFSVWRSYINGEGVGSNMELIDEAYGQINEDIAAMHTELSDDISAVRDDLESELQNAQSELDSNISSLRDDLESELQNAQSELDSNISSLRDDLSEYNVATQLKLQEIKDMLDNIRTEFDQKLEDALNNTDDLIIDCGSAEGYLDNSTSS